MAYSYASLFGIAATGLRFFTVYGPWGRPDMAMWLFTAAILEGKPIKLFNDGHLRRDFTYIDDVTEAVSRLLTRPPRSDAAGEAVRDGVQAPSLLYNVGNSQPVEVNELVRLIEEAVGRPAVREYLPLQPGDVLETSADCTELERAVGFRPNTPLKDGVRHFVEWFQAFQAARPAPQSESVPKSTTPQTPAPSAPEDDRNVITPGGRVILLVEDDPAFAMILRDLVHEMGFQCVAAASANEGLIAAGQYLPSAILLDVNLPDHSGLGVLDALKRDPRTRHIPVHMISVSDYKREALELGAIGYALKPAKREELVEVLRRLEAKFSQSVRRVLIVEDDARQRESVRQLLSNAEVQITAVASAGEALDHLKDTTFDCMVLDLNLPDLSGYDLLEKMSRQEDVGFPPVIIYTGRALDREEEQRLRRYSKSIIIKDARSPERLLGEVTLFLHQVEAKLPPEHQQMLKTARDRESMLEGRRVLIVEDDVRNVFALSSVLEPKGITVNIARNGREALDVLARCSQDAATRIDLVLMDIMMPEMDGLTAMREIRKRGEWKNLPIIALTAKAMADDHDKSLAAGANDYIAKPLDVEKLLSLVRVWMPK